MVEIKKMFSDELEELVCRRNRFMELLQAFQEEDVRMTNSVLYQTNLIDGSESLELQNLI